MNKQKAIEIVAKYMGWVVDKGSGNCLFRVKLEHGYAEKGKCSKLDTYVPVWEKIRRLEFTGYNACDGYHFTLYNHHNMKKYSAISITIQEAALVATAKCIGEL